MDRQISEGRLMTAAEFERYLGTTRNMTYTLLHRADFPTIKINGSLYALRAEVDVWLRRQVEQGGYKFGEKEIER